LTLLVGASCQAKSKSDVRYDDNPASPGWVLVEEGDAVRISVDTSGMKPDQSPQDMWIALNDVSTAEKRASTSPALRFETRQEVDCDKKLARGLDIRNQDSTGHFYVTPVRRSSLLPFSAAKLGAATLTAVCRKLAELRAHRSGAPADTR
jgi:hypothetical protein